MILFIGVCTVSLHHERKRSVFFTLILSMKRKFCVTCISHWNVVYLYLYRHMYLHTHIHSLTHTNKTTLNSWGKNKRVYFYMSTVFFASSSSSSLSSFAIWQTSRQNNNWKKANLEWNGFTMNFCYYCFFFSYFFSIEIVCLWS